MKFGLVGYGKMGSEIFSVLFDNLADTQYTIVSIGDMTACREKIEKNLARQHKRGKLSDAEYDRRMNAFEFTEDYEALRGCDAVLECIFENLDAKQELMQKLSGIVSENCLLLSNTSSLKIADVFAKAAHPERCLGMHFFYPVKLSGVAELNMLPENTPAVLDAAEKILTDAGKQALRFSGAYHIYLNQILSLTIAAAIYLREQSGCGIAAFDKSVSEMFPIAPPFEILDTVSLGLMSGSPEGFQIARNSALLQYGYERMTRWVSEGCPKEPGRFYEYMQAHETAKECDTAAFADVLTALLVNETAKAAAESGCGGDALSDAVRDVLGLAESPAAYYRMGGYAKWNAILQKIYAETEFSTFAPAEEAMMNEIYGC